MPRLAPAAAEDGTLAIPGSNDWRLAVDRTGRLDSLALVPAPEQPLAAGQVRIAVRASGLNFRDVLLALGMYPGELHSVAKQPGW